MKFAWVLCFALVGCGGTVKPETSTRVKSLVSEALYLVGELVIELEPAFRVEGHAAYLAIVDRVLVLHEDTEKGNWGAVLVALPCLATDVYELLALRGMTIPDELAKVTRLLGGLRCGE